MTIVQIRAKGLVTLPAEMRRKYNLNQGDVMTLIDLGEGCFVLSPKISSVEAQANQIANILQEKGVTEDEMLRALAEEREQYYQENYGQP